MEEMKFSWGQINNVLKIFFNDDREADVFTDTYRSFDICGPDAANDLELSENWDFTVRYLSWNLLLSRVQKQSQLPDIVIMVIKFLIYHKIVIGYQIVLNFLLHIFLKNVAILKICYFHQFQSIFTMEDSFVFTVNQLWYFARILEFFRNFG